MSNWLVLFEAIVVISTGLVKGSIWDVVFDQMILDNREYM